MPLYQPSAPSEDFGGYMARTNATTLTLSRDTGDIIRVSGNDVPIGASGIVLVTTDNLIDGTGADSGGAMGASTLYYVYVSNGNASFAPSDLRGSTTAPTAVNGVRYLGSSGNALNWRFCGYVRTNGSSQLQQDNTFIGAVNWYNQRVIRAGVAPGYVDDNATTSYTKAAGVFGPLNGGTGSRITFVADGRSAVRLQAHAVCTNGVGGSTRVAISTLDSTTDTTEQGVCSDATSTWDASSFRDTVPSEGVHTVDILGSTNGATGTYLADDVRNGAVADPACSFLQVVLLG